MITTNGHRPANNIALKLWGLALVTALVLCEAVVLATA